jgi:hypothetical protein
MGNRHVLRLATNGKADALSWVLIAERLGAICDVLSEIRDSIKPIDAKA